jgi:hypothetical protein
MRKLKQTLIIILTVGGILSGCNQNPEPTSLETTNVISDPKLDAVAKSLAASLADPTVRTLIKTEAMKKFDGDLMFCIKPLRINL